MRTNKPKSRLKKAKFDRFSILRGLSDGITTLTQKTPGFSPPKEGVFEGKLTKSDPKPTKSAPKVTQDGTRFFAPKTRQKTRQKGTTGEAKMREPTHGLEIDKIDIPGQVASNAGPSAGPAGS